MVLSVSDCPWDALQICLQLEMLGFQLERVVYLLKDIECLFIVLSNITMISILVCSFYLNKSSYCCEMFIFIWSYCCEMFMFIKVVTIGTSRDDFTPLEFKSTKF